MTKMVFDWKPDSRFPVGAQVAAERLSHIKSRSGEITPRAVVDDARPASSPLHDCFTWDDAKAADEHRLWQARKLIGSIVVVQFGDEKIEKETRAFVHIAADAKRYEPVEVALADREMRGEVLARATSEIKRWRARYGAYREFADLVQQIDETIASIPAAISRGEAMRGLVHHT